MKKRCFFIIFILFVFLLIAAAGGCALKSTEAVPASPAPETPAPVISAVSSATAPPKTPEPTETPAPRQTVEYGDDIHGLIISEVMFSAKAARVYGEAAGFIELYNGGGSPVSLSGMYLSDRFDDPERYPLPDVTLAAGEYYVFTLKGEAAEKNYELPFFLSESDDGLLLYLKEECLAVKYVFPERPEKDVSVSPRADGTVLWCAYPTPGQKNAALYTAAAERENSLLNEVYISEVSAAGAGWLELKNGGKESVSLTGWYWTNDPDEPKKEAAAGTLPAGGYTVLRPESLRLSASGETLCLYDNNGFLRDTFTTGVLTDGMTSGRTDSAARVFFDTPTEGEPNGTGSPAAITPAPVFSETALYHDTAFTLTLTCADPNAAVYYTLNGSAPTEKSTLYTGPISVESSLSVRAVAVSAGKTQSDESTVCYIFGEAHSLPVMYIDMDPALFKRLTNVPHDEGGLKEQACYVSYYEADGRLAASFPAGVKPRGNASMSYPQKSLSLHLRKSYGQKDVRCDFWNTGITGPYSALVLRNSGQDTNGCHFRDSFAHRASANLRMDTQHTRPVVVYVNGAYYGVLDLMDNMNKATFSLRYGVEEDAINIVQRNDHVVTGSADGFVALRKYAKSKDFTDDAVVAEFAKSIDLDAVTDYIIAQSFFGNYDIHNQNYWSSADGSVTWRPFLYDVDRCLNKTSMSSNVLAMYFNPAGIVHDRQGDRIMMEIYCGLKTNETWKNAFLRRYAYLLCNDYSAETLLALVDTMAEEIRPEMERHTAKFGTPSSLSAWEKNVADLRQNITDRRAVIEKHIRSVFKITEEEWAAIIAPYEAGAAWEG